MSGLLNAGRIPVPLSPVYEQTVSPALGADFVDMSLKAGMIGIMLVMLFMIIYYRISGLLACLALTFYGLLVLAVFKLIPVTLTLAGLGGFILSIGMAVDANILIFERMKEELRAGRTLGAAIETGFNRAWTAIKDSNVTTFIVCGILFWLGSAIVASAPVKGFALTLFIGVAVSMFTAIVVTRTLLRLFVSTGVARRTALFTVGVGLRADEESNSATGGRRAETVFDIIGKRFRFLLISGVVILLGIIFLATLGLKPGIEFSSGSMLTLDFEGEVERTELQQELAQLGYASAMVQSTGAGDYIIRTHELSADERARLEESLTQGFGPLTETEFHSISPMIAQETARNAVIGVVIAAVGVLLYVIWAFRRMPRPFHYGTCAIAALVHDALMALGVFSLLGGILNWEINVMFITGVLAVIGYSVNNTVVIFDRIRENLMLGVSPDFEVVVNNSLVQTLGRSLNTSVTTLIVVLSLLLFVGDSIQNFVVVLIIGLVAGTFSSVCIAPSLVVFWNRGEWNRFTRWLRPRRQ